MTGPAIIMLAVPSLPALIYLVWFALVLDGTVSYSPIAWLHFALFVAALSLPFVLAFGIALICQELRQYRLLWTQRPSGETRVDRVSPPLETTTAE